MGRKRTFAEAEVLEMARDRFWTTGYDGTSTYDLMESTGLGKGSLYKAFGNKHDLYMRVFSDYCQQLVAGAREALQDTSLPSVRGSSTTWSPWPRASDRNHHAADAS